MTLTAFPAETDTPADAGSPFETDVPWLAPEPHADLYEQDDDEAYFEGDDFDDEDDDEPVFDEFDDEFEEGVEAEGESDDEDDEDL